MKMLRIFCRLITIVYFFGYHGLKLSVKLVWHAPVKNEPFFYRLIGTAIKDFCESTGATFIKIGQIASTRPDLFPHELLAPLARLQEQVAPFSRRKIRPAIEENFNRPLSEIFSDFEFRPIASASIAQVHQARLPDGTEVAVKIRRPHLAGKVYCDLKLLYAFAWLLSKLKTFRFIPLIGLCREFSQAIEQQLDFRREAENNRQFRRNFSSNSRIRFPALVESLCTDSVLTMEFMADRVKVEDLDCSQNQKETLAVEGLRAFYQMMFSDGLVHGDMHPGNIFFKDQDEIIILDTGLVARLNETTKKNFTEFFFGMVTRNGHKCGQVIFDSATEVRSDFDEAKFFAVIAEIVDKHSEKSARDFEVTSFATDLFTAQRSFGIRGATDFTMTIVSLVVFEGIMKQIYPELDFQDEARRFILKTKFGIMPPRSIGQHATAH